MAAVILSESAQQRIVQLEQNLDVYLVPVDSQHPDMALTPSADYSSLDNDQLSALNNLESEIGCILLAVEHR